MSDVIKYYLGDSWVDYFNVEDDLCIIEDYLDYDDYLYII